MVVRLVRRKGLVATEVPRIWIAQTIVQLEILLAIIHENIQPCLLEFIEKNLDCH